MVIKVIFAFIFIFFNSLRSQTYNPFNIKNKEYSLSICHKVGGGYGQYTQIQYDDRWYTICDDSVIINTKKYKTIYSKIHSYGNYSANNIYSGYYLYGYFRQDSILKRSYLLLPSWTTDSLILDYNLQVGDTVKRGFYYFNTIQNSGIGNLINWKILKIQNKNIYGSTIRCFYTDTSNMGTASYFMEGLGHTWGLFLNSGTAETYCWPFERCSNINSIQTLSNCISLVNTLTDNENINSEIKIYPSPTNEYLNIELDLNSQVKITDPDSKIIILNVFGQTIFEDNLIDIADKKSIDTRNFNNGIYYFILKNKNSTTYIKHFVVTH